MEWRNKTQGGWLLLAYTAICELLLVCQHSDKFADDPLELLLVSIYSFPLCAFLLLALSVMPYCLIGALGLLKDKHIIKEVVVLTIAATGLLLMYK